MVEPVLDIFREEAREHLHALEKGFLDLETAQATEGRRALIDSLFRHAHSLKGDAKAVGLLTLKEAAQSLEDLLDALRSHPEDVNPTRVNEGLAKFDEVRAAYEAWQRAGIAQPAAEPVAAQPAAPFTAPAPPNIAPVEAAPPTSRLASASAAAVGPAMPEESFTVRVSSDRLDRMLNLAGEARISQRSTSAVQGRLSDLSDHLAGCVRECPHQSPEENRQAFEFALDQVRRISNEIHNRHVGQELLLEGLEADIRQARLLPLLMLTEAMRRAVRELSQSLGKAIRYEVDVGQILLDKAVIEALRDPLLHLIRNAADHGIELPAERAAAGKPSEGVIRIQASQQGPVVRITVSDDGRGVDYQRVRARLRRTGELSDEDMQQLPDHDLIPHLFKPGFTTASAGEVSGRGVGLDVVADTVRKLQGTVALETSSPAGTTFAITVPVTISSIRVLTVSTGSQTFGIPSSAVVRTGRAKRQDLREFEAGFILNVDGEPLRWAHLADLLGIASSHLAANSDTWSYLLVKQHGRQLAVAVDDLEDESEVLLKPLGFPLGGQPGMLGATIRSDGSVQLVLDLASSSFTSGETKASRTRTPVRQARRIMIVDDSPTTRAIMLNLFTAAGYAVVTATDGLDALERLRTHPVDLVVSDVEMPRLNGFDLTRQVKLKFGLPVILVTGREKEEHRREGLEAGADAYVIKSTFEGQGLLDVVEQFA
jgi:two-component system, chemotaxis family, sensor kinase CheA